jgi:hypothetical protein
MQQIAPNDQLLVWDTVGEWQRVKGLTRCATLADLHRLVSMNFQKPLHLRAAYVGPISRQHFEVFCTLAWVWMRSTPRGVLVVEELADVTSPAKAPPAWGEIVRKGRHQGGRIYALTQRPAESDKTIAGNADIIHTGRLSFPKDRASLAEYLDVPVQDVADLPSLAYIERDMRTRELRTGRVSFKKNR